MKIELLNMKNLLLVLAMLPVWASSYAMSEPVDSVASKEYSDKYDMLVSRLGVAGVGIETVLDNWAKVDPDNRKMLLARYSYYLTKGQTTVVVDQPGRKYLGNAPLFSLKDSTGANVNYFEETVYDDSLFAMALRNIDRVIDLYPHDLDLQFVKAAALLSYEKDSPDMALVCLDGMADRYYSDRGADWKFEEDTVDDEFFEGAVQEYCYTFFNIASQPSYVAFKLLSEKMLEHAPDSPVFLSNLGSYYFVVEKDTKKAMKYYRKVLKIDPENYSAVKNIILICRQNGNVKEELKHLPVLMEVSPDESERFAAKARIDALSSKKR